MAYPGRLLPADQRPSRRSSRFQPPKRSTTCAAGMPLQPPTSRSVNASPIRADAPVEWAMGAVVWRRKEPSALE
jgi:hypothetical protein